MKKNYSVWSLLTVMMVGMLSVGFSSCSGDDDAVSTPPKNPTSDSNVTDPDKEVPDPEGTITLSMRNANNGDTYLDERIHIDKSDNFSGSYSSAVQIVSLGKMKGIGNISQIPKKGWSNQVSVVPGEGYIAYANNKFYRLYVVEEIVNTSGGVIGAMVKYHAPFGGKDEAIKVEKNEVSLKSEGGSETIKITNSSIISFSVVSSQPWCTAYSTTTDGSIFPNAVYISVSQDAPLGEAVVTLETVYGKKTTIKVTTVPTMSIDATQANITFDAKASIETIKVYGNVDLSQITATSDAAWCTVKHNGLSADKKYAMLQISATANPTETPRNAIVTIKSKDVTTTIPVKVTQEGGSLNVETNAVTMDAKASTQNVIIRGNIDLSKISATSNVEWCEVITHGKVFNDEKGIPFSIVTISVTNNPIETKRYASITVKSTENTAMVTLNVTQNGSYFTVPITEINYDRKSHYQTIRISTSATEWEASSSASWCTFSKNGNELTIRVTETTTDRTATISFKNFSATIKVHQSKYAVGDTYNENGVKGTVAYMGDDVRYIVSNKLDEVAWSMENVSTGARNEDDGTKNMAVIHAIPNFKTLYPAIALVDEFSESNGGSWYLPAHRELLKVSAFIENNAWNKTAWSSTEYDSSRAYDIFTNNSTGQKSSIKPVYAIRKF